MSSIYGYTINLKKQNKGLDKSKIEIWNSHYGAKKTEVYSDDNTVIGAYVNRAFEFSGDGLFRLNNKIYALDAVIYNAEELRTSLGVNVDATYTEILARYIDQKGLAELDIINGDFAGAVFDIDNRKTTLFTDHMGIRPLFYYAHNGLLAFSTDIRGLTALDEVDKSIYDKWVFKQLSGDTMYSDERTELEHIYRVKPGSFIEFTLDDNQEFSKHLTRYWRLGQHKIRLGSREEYAKKLRALIEDSVKIRLAVCNGKVGAELSGGLDSGVIDILINRMGRKAVYCSWSKSPDELPWAEGYDERRAIVEICEQEHITCSYSGEYKFDGNETMGRVSEQKGLKFKESYTPALPYALPPYVNTMPLYTTADYVAQNGCSVVFTGHGGDEGVSHRCNDFELCYNHEYYRYLRQKWSETHGKNKRILKALQGIKKDYAFYHKKMTESNTMSLPLFSMMKPEFRNAFSKKDPCYFAFDSIKYIESGATINRPNCTAVLAAYAGVQYIYPFLDYRVIDYAVSIPRYLYKKGGQNRAIYREAFKDIMPKALYKTVNKNDGSDVNIKETGDWFIAFQKNRADLVDSLDRKMWDKYLDFDKLEEWKTSPRPSDEDRDAEEFSFIFLFQCYMLENMIKKSAEVKEN